jgi:hypothetical protein
MGHHQSKQTVDVSTKVAANIVQNTAQDCITVGYGSNKIKINGNYNAVEHVAQKVSVGVDSNCSTFSKQNSSFKTDLQNGLSQTLKDQEVAMTEWMDNSRDTQSDHVRQSVTANFTQNAVQNCVNGLVGINDLYVMGNGNVVKDITQDATLSILARCVQGNGQTNSVVSDITNTINQHSQYTSQNPLAFISDAFAAMAQSAAAVAAIIFIVVICFVFVFVILHRSGESRRPEARRSESRRPE